jgi:hypothetical protein
MKTVRITVKSDRKASRIELLARIVWIILCSISLIIAGILAGLAIIIQLFHILVFGKRQMALNTYVTNWVTYSMQIAFYKNLCTDERPPLIPKL